MVKILKDAAKAEKLFPARTDSLVDSCLQRVMGAVCVTDEEDPRSAAAMLGSFIIYGGEPSRELVLAKPAGGFSLTPPDEEWAKLIVSCFPGAVRYPRRAADRNARFDRAKLRSIAGSLPAGYELRRIDAELYRICLNDPVFADGVKNFGTEERYCELGRGIAVLKNGRIVSACSSYSRYREGIETEVDTLEEERRKGLASAASAALILLCLDEGLYPCWDAANGVSVRLAEKLGYTFGGEYSSYWIE